VCADLPAAGLPAAYQQKAGYLLLLLLPLLL
jgi:hypothetical protein